MLESEKESKGERKLNKYQAMLIFVGCTKEDVLGKFIGKVQEEIEKYKGKVTNTNVIGKRMFARPMNKHDGGVYAKLDLDLDPSTVDDLLARFKLNEDVFRVQITRVAEPKVVAETVAETVAEAVAEPVAKKGAGDGEL